MLFLLASRVHTSGCDILNNTISKLGCPYVYGQAGPNTFDCSGLVYWVHKQCGISIPRTIRAQANGGRCGDGSAGDIVVFGNPAYHVGICCGNGNCVHAESCRDVRFITIKHIDYNFRYRRYY